MRELPVPTRISKRTGLDKYKFLVKCPWAFPVKYIEINGNIEKIPPSAYCIVNRTNILVEKKKFIHLYDVIIAIASLTPFTPYVRRYMTIYKSYEGLTKIIPIELRAIRHGISHSSAALSNPKTINTLEKLFGTKRIDFKKRKHIDVFYENFSQMLMLHDQVLYEHIMRKKSLFRILKNNDRIVRYWEIKRCNKISSRG